MSAVDSWQQFLASVTMVSKHQEALLYYQMMKIILSFMTRKLLYILAMLYKREKLILFHQEDIAGGIFIKGVENRDFSFSLFLYYRAEGILETCKFHTVFCVFIKQLWSDQNLFYFFEKYAWNYFYDCCSFFCKHKGRKGKLNYVLTGFDQNKSYQSALIVCLRHHSMSLQWIQTISYVYNFHWTKAVLPPHTKALM